MNKKYISLKNVSFDPETSVDNYLKSRCYDALVISGEGGYAPLASFSQANNVLYHASNLAEDSEEATLVRILHPELGTMIVCPSERSTCYRQYGTPDEGAPSRDFYYNVSYEAFKVCKQAGAKKIAMTHLCGGGMRFSENPSIAACAIEAWVHLFGDNGALGFVGCCIDTSVIEKAKNLIMSDAALGEHREIAVKFIDRYDFEGANVATFKLNWNL